MADGVSVVIPSRDRAHIVIDTVRLTLGQRDVEFEIIVVDDGSRDGTAEVLEALGDPRVVVLRNAVNRGVAHARNRGIKQAAHPWIAFLDDDDRWSPDKLRVQLDRIAAEAADFAYTAGLAVAAGDAQVLYLSPRSRPMSCGAASAAATSSSRARPTCSRAPSCCGVSAASTSRCTTSRTGICGSV